MELRSQKPLETETRWIIILLRSQGKIHQVPQNPFLRKLLGSLKRLCKMSHQKRLGRGRPVLTGKTQLDPKTGQFGENEGRGGIPTKFPQVILQQLPRGRQMCSNLPIRSKVHLPNEIEGIFSLVSCEFDALHGTNAPSSWRWRKNSHQKEPLFTPTFLWLM